MTTTCNIGSVGFIGLGQMATALASGFLRAGLVSAERLFGFDVSPDAAARFASTTGATVCADAAETVA
ncbi:MAG: NAD(P)-binding domain-containing protein, partial [Thermoguttaceae bacterium]|nr:NAD(P)-binding domain-containing protein [Thermoguttaceae bacterium]